VHVAARVALCCSVHRGALECVAVRCSILQCDAVCCNMMQCVAPGLCIALPPRGMPSADKNSHGNVQVCGTARARVESLWWDVVWTVGTFRVPSPPVGESAG